MINPALLGSLKSYRKKFLLSDLFSGLMVAVVALPLSIALGIQSGGSLQMGLITAILGGFLISVFGGSRNSIGGPSASFVALSVGILANSALGIDGFLLAMLIAGVLLVLFGLCRAGRLLGLVPNTVTAGLTAGIGILLMFGQFGNFLGLTLPAFNPTDPLTRVSPFLGSIRNLFLNLWGFQIGAFCIGAFSLILIFTLPKINKKIPVLIVTIILSTIIVFVLKVSFGIEIATIKSVYGEVNVSFYFIQFDNIQNIHLLIIPAITIAIVASLEGYMSASVGESISGFPFNANRELIGHGIANIACGLCGGMPVVGALARTNVNITSGAKSPLSGIFAAIILLLFYLFFMPALQYIPLAALSAVLIKVAISMCRFKLFIHLATFGKRDAGILITTFLTTIIFGVLWGVIAGLVVAIAVNARYFGRKMTLEKLTIEELNHNEKFVARTKENGELIRKTIAFHVSGSIFFANIGSLLNVLKRAVDDADEIVLDMENIHDIDATAVAKLARLAQILSKSGKHLVPHNISPIVYRRYRIAFEQIIYSWK